MPKTYTKPSDAELKQKLTPEQYKEQLAARRAKQQRDRSTGQQQ